MTDLRRLRWPEIPSVDLMTEFAWIIHREEQEDRINGSPCRSHEDDGDSWIIEGPHEAVKTYDKPQIQSLILDEATHLQYCKMGGIAPNKHAEAIIGGSSKLGQSMASVTDGVDVNLSPYHQKLQHPKQIRSPPSPAQRAAKKMLLLKEEMQHLGTEWQASTTNVAMQVVDHPKCAKQTVSNHFQGNQPSSIVLLRQDNASVPKIVSPTKKISFSLHKPSHKDSAASVRTPSSQSQRRNKKMRPETRDEQNARDLREKQLRLGTWLEGDNKRYRQEEKLLQISRTTCYSMEMEAKMQSAMTNTIGKGLWEDPVTSLIAAEMTSEAIFGGFVKTRRLAYYTENAIQDDPKLQVLHPKCSAKYEKTDVTAINEVCSLSNLADQRAAIDKTPQQCNDFQEPSPSGAPVSIVHNANIDMIVNVAEEIREKAHKQVEVGAVTDALATLQEGINQLLNDFHDNQDEIQLNGFNYSEHAHRTATWLQLKYRARHRMRVQQVAVLQQCWRRFRARNRFITKKRYETCNAEIIQRHFRQHLQQLRRDRSARRIQKCFRVYQEQKILVCLRRACRLLARDEWVKRENIRRKQARKQRTWSKLSMILKVIWLWRIRSYSIICMQKRWKARKQYARYMTILADRTEREAQRRSREVAFLKPKLDEAMIYWRCFLQRTNCGRDLVKWHMQIPWIRFQRARISWQSLDLDTRIEALCGIYKGKRVSGMELEAIWEELTFNTEALKISRPKEMVLSFENLAFHLKHSSSLEVGKQLHEREYLKKAQWRTLGDRIKERTAKQLKDIRRWTVNSYWHMTLWCKFYYLGRWSCHNYQQALADLENDQARCLTTLLRHLFRQMSQNAPAFACEWCYEGFGTAKEYYKHKNESEGLCALARQRANAEWDALINDINFLQTNRKTKISKNDNHEKIDRQNGRFNFSEFQLDDIFVKKLHMKKSNHLDLEPLLQIALICANDEEQINRSNTKLSYELVGYLLRCFQDDKDFHPLLRLPLHQFVEWKGEEKDASTWIRADQLYERLGVKIKWPTPSIHNQARQTVQSKFVVVQMFKSWMTRVRRPWSKYTILNAGGSASSATVLPVA